MNRDLFAAGGGVDATTDPYFNSTTLLLSGDGTNGAQNNTFIDSSVNNATITRAGTPTQGSFSPFSQTGWSGYFPGTSSDFINVTLASSLGTASFTIEFWFYNTDLVNQPLFSLGSYLTGIDFRLSETGAGGANSLGSYFYNVAHADVFTSTNTWQHLAIVRSSGTTTVYLNGSIFMAGFSDTNNYASTSLRIGGYQSGSTVRTGFLGYISNVRVVKGVAVYTGNFTPPTAPLTATQAAGTNIAAITGTATSLLTLQDNRFKDNSTNNFAIGAYGTPSVQAFSPLAPTAAYSLPAAAAGSAYFNGSSYISVPDSTAFTMGSGEFTLEAWVYLTTSGTSRMIFGTCDAAGSQGSMSYVLSINASNNAFFAVGYGGSMYGSTNTATVPTNQWVHIAGVRSGANVYVYLNGMQSTSNTNMGALAITDSTQVVAIGRNGAGNFEYLTGYISNARITKGTAVYTGNFTPSGTPLSKIQSAGTNIAALSGTETSILTLQDSTFKDNSVNVATITASSPAPVIQSFTPFTQVWGGYFDGSGYSTLTMSNTTSLAMGTGNFTIEFWINTSNIAQTGYVLQTDTSPNTLYISLSGSTIRLTNQSTPFAVTPTLLSNTWYHIAVVRSGTSSVIYTNGVAGTAVTCSIDFTQAGPAIGNNSFIGYISNLRIVKGVAVYTGAFTPPAKTLSATQAAGTNISAITGTATSLLTLQDPTFKDNAAISNTITAAGTPKAQLVSAPFTSAATVDPVNGSGYFDGGSNLLVPSGAPFNLTTVDFCIEMWVYPIAQSTYGSLLTFDAADYPLMFNWANALSANIRFYIGSSTGWIPGMPLDFGTTVLKSWAHLCVTRTNGVFRSFKDGVLSTVLSGQESFSIGNSADSISIGSNGGNFSAAYISNLRIIKGTGNVPAAYQTSSTTLGTAIFTPPTAPLTAVTGTSLLTLQDTTFKDNSTNALAITAAGSPSMRAFTPFASNWGGYFDGSSQLICANNSAFAFFTNNFTVECWLYPLSSGGQSVMNYSNGQSVAQNFAWEMYQVNGTQILFGIYDSDSASGYNASSTTLSINKWNHIAVVRNGNTMSMYVNGVVGGTTVSVPGVSVFNKSAATLKVSGYNNATYQYTGYVSNARIVNGTAVYTTNFTPPSAPLTAITNTSLLTLQNNTFIDNSTNALAITATGAPKTQLLQLPFTSSITKVPAPWNISVTEPLATVGGSMYFDGSGDTITAPSNSAFAFGTGDFTIESWVYITSYAGTCGIFDTRTTGNEATGVIFNVNASGMLLIYNSAAQVTATTALTVNTWNHAAVTRSGTLVNLWLNGVSVGSGTVSTNYSQQNGFIGAAYTGINNMMLGYISNLRVIKGTAVYTGAFTPPAAPPQPTQTPGLLGTNVNAIDGTNTSLLLLGSNAGIYDATAKNDIITVGNAQVSSTQIKYGTGAMYFDGTGDYLTMPASPNFAFGTGDYTVEFWMYQTYAANAQVMLEVGRLAATASPGFQFDTINGPLTVYYGSSIGTALSSGITLTINVWYHIALTRQAGSTKLFVNGTQGGSTVTDNTNYTTGAVWVGANAGGAANAGAATCYYFGYLDDLRITKGIARYTTTFTPPTKAMIGQ